MDDSPPNLQLAAVAAGASADNPLDALELREMPVRPVVEGEVRVPLAAAAINHHDVWTLRGIGAVELKYPRVMGSDGAGEGTVLYPLLGCPDPAMCWGCDGDLSLCRRATLLGESRDGTFAGSVTLPAAHVCESPPHLSHEEAACLPSAYLTAWNMLFRAGQVHAGDRILVTGATGGLGVAAIQLGAAAGCEMIALVRNMSDAPALRELGATDVIATSEDVRTRAGGYVDTVLESVGKATWHTSLRAVRPGGTIVVSGATTGDPQADLRRIFWRQIRVVGASMGSLDDFRALLAFVGEHELRPAIAAVYPLREIRAAFEVILRGRVLGKVVVNEL